MRNSRSPTSVLVLGALALLGLLRPASAQTLNFVATTVDPIVNSTDGRSSFAAEWTSASNQADIGGEGCSYAQSKGGWIATSSSGSSFTYAGLTGFVVHDISTSVTQEAADYNTFEFVNAQTGDKVMVWVLANGNEPNDSGWLPNSMGLEVSHLIPEGTGADLIDDRGFIVRLNNDPMSDRHWLPGMAEPGDSSFSWANWFGVFGTSGFNDSAWQHSLPLAVPGANEFYEIALRMPPFDVPPQKCQWVEIKFLDPKNGDPNKIQKIMHSDPSHHDYPIPIPTNHTPELAPPEPPGNYCYPGFEFHLEFHATDRDGDPIAFSSSAGAIPGASFTDHGNGTASLDFTPTPAQAGRIFKLGVVCNDGAAQSAVRVIPIQVVAPGAFGNFLPGYNGTDLAAFTLPTSIPPSNVGIYRVFDERLLHAPTRVTDPSSPLAGTYAAKVTGLQLGLRSTAPLPATVTVPYVMFSSSTSPTSLVDGSGTPDYGTQPGTCVPAGYSGINGVVGVNGAGPATVLRELCDVEVTTTFDDPSGGRTLIVPLDPPVYVPEGEHLVVYVVIPSGAEPQMSIDEPNNCESASFYNDAAFGLHQLAQTEEFCLTLSLLDATTSVAVKSRGSGNLGLNANHAAGFDAGMGGRTVSITGTDPTGSLGTEVICFMTSDSGSPIGGSARLVIMNLASVFSGCGVPGFPLPSGGFGGPTLSTAIPEAPRIPVRLDSLAVQLLASPTWLMVTLHDTSSGGANAPWAPIPDAIAGASGIGGGPALVVPPLSTLPGLEFAVCSLPLDGPLSTATSVSAIMNSGHSISMGSTFTFYP